MIKKIGNILKGTVIFIVLLVVVLYAADDAKIKLTDALGVSKFAVRDSGDTTVMSVDSDGNTELKNQAELRLLEQTINGTQYTGFKAPASLGANVIYTLPSADATSSGQVLSSNASGTLSWVTRMASLGGLTAQDQTFVNDTNVTMTSSGSTHTLGWTGVLAKTRQHSATVYNDQANTFLSGFKQTVTPSSTTAGLNIGNPSSDPTTLSPGDIWTTGDNLKFRGSTATRTVEVTANKGAASGYAPLDASSMVPLANMPTGTVILLYADETNSTEVAGPTTETTLKSWTLPNPLPYTRIILEAEVRGRQEEDANENPIYTWRFKEGTTIRKALDWRLLCSNTGAASPANDGLRMSATIKTSWASPTAGATVSLTVQWSEGTAADASDYLMANSFRVYGVK